MLGLLGLLGAVMAGFMVDALMAQDPDEPSQDDDEAAPQDADAMRRIDDDLEVEYARTLY